MPRLSDHQPVADTGGLTAHEAAVRSGYSPRFPAPGTIEGAVASSFRNLLVGDVVAATPGFTLYQPTWSGLSAYPVGALFEVTTCGAFALRIRAIWPERDTQDFAVDRSGIVLVALGTGHEPGIDRRVVNPGDIVQGPYGWRMVTPMLQHEYPDMFDSLTVDYWAELSDNDRHILSEYVSDLWNHYHQSYTREREARRREERAAAEARRESLRRFQRGQIYRVIDGGHQGQVVTISGMSSYQESGGIYATLRNGMRWEFYPHELSERPLGSWMLDLMPPAGLTFPDPDQDEHYHDERRTRRSDRPAHERHSHEDNDCQSEDLTCWLEEGECEEDCVACYENDDQDGLINDYSYRPRPVFYGEGPVYLGVELEVLTGYDNYEAQELVHDLLGDTVYLKHDGSIEGGGFEIVTHPMSFDFAKGIIKREYFTQLKAKGARPHSSCGLHVHVSRAAFSSPAHSFKWLKFFYRNHNFIERIARRASSQWATFGHPDDVDRKGQKWLAKGATSHTRYTAVNASNVNTFEVRVFAATMNPQKFFAALGLVDATVEYTRGLTYEEIAKRDGWSSEAFKEWLTLPENADRYEDLNKEIERLGA